MSGNNETTQTQTNEPYAAAKPLLDTAMGDAKKLYSSGGLNPINTQSTVVPYAQQTTAGMNSIQNTAQDAMAPGGLNSQFQSIIGNGGFNQPQMDAVNNTRTLANSSYDMNANPGFGDVLNQALEKSSFGNNQNASAMGRYGSGQAQDVMQRANGDIASNMIYGDYNNWQNRRDAANTQLFQQGQTGMDNMNPAYASLKAPAEDLMKIGGMNEDLMGRLMNDSIRINDAKLNKPKNDIMALLAAASGAGSYGTQTGTSQGPNSTLSNIAGGGLGLLSLL